MFWIAQPKIERRTIYLNGILCLLKAVIFSYLFSGLFLNIVFAMPEGGHLRFGHATIQTQSRATNINQSSKKVIIDWRSFNIAQNESVHFQQPANGIALNRISPLANVSQIYGKLTATGHIILSNPAGIYFGPHAFVSVGKIIATTANLSNRDFIKNRFNFTSAAESNGSIINEGTIVAKKHGLIALIAPHVINKGMIRAHLGRIILGAGRAFTMSFDDNDLIQFTIDQEVISDTPNIVNTGALIANGGSILVTAKVAEHVLDHVINIQGIVQADSVHQQKGDIFFTANAGIISVAGNVSAAGKRSAETGGMVKMVGHRLVIDNANIDVSGDSGGGQAFLGGAAHGLGWEQNAAYSYVGSNSVIDASAINTGNGGQVVIWSDVATGFYGKINAYGGKQSGNGGWIETSSKGYLDAQGIVGATASFGRSGEWLLDPADVTISTSATTNGTFSGGNPDTFTPNATTNTAIANVDKIISTLNNGTSVTITTTSNGTGNGDIIVASPIPKTAGPDETLTLTASDTGTILVNHSISSTTGKLTVNLNGAKTININADIITNDAPFSASATDSIVFAANVNAKTKEFTATTTGANSSILQTGGMITTTGLCTLTVPTTSSGGIGTAAKPINMTGNGTITLTTGAGGVYIYNTGDVTLAPPSLNANSSISVTSTGRLTLPNMPLSTGTGDIYFEGKGDQLTTANNLSTTSGNITLISGVKEVIVNDLISSTSGTLNLTGVGVTVKSFDINVGTGNINVNAGTGSLTMSARARFLAGDPTGETGIVHIIAKNMVLDTSGSPSQIGGTGVGTGISNAVILEPSIAGTTIGLAGGAGTFALSANEAKNVQAKNVTIGNNIAGQITINAFTPDSLFASGGTLTLNTNAGITQSGALNFTTDLAGLTENANGLVAINANITTTNKPIVINGVGITQASNVVVNAGTADLTYNARTGTLTTNNATSLFSTGTIRLSGNSMTLATDTNSKIGGTSTGGSAIYTIITPGTAGTTIGLGGGAGALNLVQAELNTIRTTNARIGAVDSGAITLGTLTAGTTFIPTTGTGVLTLASGAGISLTAVGGITMKNLIIRGAGNFNLTTNATNNITNLAADISSGSLSVTNAANNTLTVMSLTDDIGTVNGINTLGSTSVTLANTGTGDITFNANTISGSGNIIVNAGRNVIINAGNLSTLGNINLQAGSGSINEASTGTINANTLSTISAVGATLLNQNAITNFNASNTTSGNISLKNTKPLFITGINQPAGNLIIDNSGAISQTAAISVTGTSVFNASANPINLMTNGQNNNFVGAVTLTTLSENDASINNNRALIFNTSSIGRNLTVTANGNISQIGALNVNGTSSFNAGANAIDLATSGGSNKFLGAVSLNNSSNKNVALVNSIPLILATSTVGAGTLSLTTGGALTQVGPVTQAAAAGLITLTSTVPLTNVDLSTAANNLSGAMTFGGTLANFQDFKLRNVYASASLPNNLNALANLRHLTLLFDNSGIIFPALTLHNGGNLLSVAGGSITQTGVLTVPGTASFSTGAFPITLTQSNQLTGDVTVNNTGKNDVAVKNMIVLSMAASNVGSGKLSLTGLGITQSGAIQQEGVADLVTIQAGLGLINLANANNHFTGPISLNNHGQHATQLTNNTSVKLAESKLGSGDVGVISAGNITQIGPITHVADEEGDAGFFTLSVTVPGSDILLHTQPNDITGSIAMGGTLSNIRDLGIKNESETPAPFSTPLSLLTNLRNFTLILDNANLNSLSAALHNGGNLYVDTSGISGGGHGGDINQLGPITVPGTTTLIAGTHNIDAGHDNSFIGSVSVSNNGAKDVSVTNIVPLVMATSGVGSGTLTLIAPGITQTGPITQQANAGTVTLQSGPNPIVLTHSDNFFTGAVQLSNSGTSNVAISNKTELKLGSSTVGSGTLSIKAAGRIYQTGAIIQEQTTNQIIFSASANPTDIDLSTAANNLSAPITFDAATLANFRDFKLRNINSSALVPTTLNGLTNLHDLRLHFDNAGMNFPALILHNGGNLTAIANGDMTQTGALIVPGTSHFSAGEDVIALLANNQLSGAVTLNNSGNHNVTINNTIPLIIGSASVGSGHLNLTGKGVSQTGPIQQAADAGPVSIQANDGPIMLGSDNQFTNAISLNNLGINDVTVKNTTELILAGSNLGSGVINLISGGNISQTGPFTQAANGGLITFTFTAPNSDLFFADYPNNFSGDLKIGGTVANLRDVFTRNVSTTGITITNIASVPLRNLTYILDNTGKVMTGANISGNLVVDTSGSLSNGVGGDITQTLPITIAGTSTFNSGAHAINLPMDNHFTGAVSISNTGNHNVTLKNLEHLTLSQAKVGSGLLTLTSVGISQTGGISEEPNTLGVTINAGAGDIDLTGNNNFSGILTLNNTGAHFVAINDLTPEILGASQIGSGKFTLTVQGSVSQSGPIKQEPSAGEVTINVGNNSINLNQANELTGAVLLNNSGANPVLLSNNIDLKLGNSIVGSSTISINANGAIIQTGTFTQAPSAGAASFTAGAHMIKLDHDNILTGPVSLTNSGANNVILKNNTALQLGTSLVGTGLLTITANGPITQSGAFTQTASAQAVTITAGANAISLNQANQFTGSVSLNNSGANNVLLNNAIELTLGTSTVGTGTLTLTGLGIKQTGAITETTGAGDVTINAGAGKIELDANNNFTGSISLNNTDANDVLLKNNNLIKLNTSTIGSGKLTLAAAGHLTQTGVLTQAPNAGLITFIQNTPGSDILLHTQANKLTGPITFDTGTVDNVRDFGLRNIEATATLPNNLTALSSFRNLNVYFDNAGLSLPALVMSGNLTLTSAGSMTQTGPLIVTGTPTLTILPGHATSDILLASAANNFATTPIINGSMRDLALRNAAVNAQVPVLPSNLHHLTLHFDNNAIALPTVTLTGSLVVKAGGAITQSGPISVNTIGALTTLEAGNANDITLNNVTNDFVNIKVVSAKNVVLLDKNNLNFALSNITDNLSVTTSGPITQTEALTVGGSLTLASGANNNIILTNSNNSFNTVGITNGNNVSLTNTTALNFANSTLAGNLTVVTNGAITQSGIFNLTGSGKIASFTAGSANNITLNNDNHFSTLAIKSGKDVSVKDVDAIVLGASTISGNVTFTAGGSITQSGTLDISVPGVITTLTAGTTSDIILTDANNTFTKIIVPQAKNLNLNDSGGIEIGAISTTGNINITESGDLLNTTGLIQTAGGKVSIGSSGAGTITIGPAGIKSSLDGTSNGGNIVILAANTTALPVAVTLNGELNTEGGTGGTTTIGGGVEVNVSPVAGAGKIFVTGNAAATVLNDNTYNVPTTISVTAKDIIIKGTQQTINGSDLTLIADADGEGLGGVFVTSTGRIICDGNLIIKGSDLLVNLGVAIDLEPGGIIQANGTIDLLGNVGSSNIFLDSQISTINVNQAINITAAGSGVINLGGSLITNGGPINLNSETSQINPVTLTTNGGAINESNIYKTNGLPLILDSGSADITFSNTNNELNTIKIINGNNVNLAGNDIVFDASTITGNLDLNASTVDSIDALTVGGITTITANGPINLDQANDFNTIVISNAHSAVVRDASDLDLGAMNINGDLTLNAGGNITESGAGIVVMGKAVVTVPNDHDIALNSADNNFNQISVITANNVLINNNAAITLDTMNLVGNLSITAAGTISQIAPLTLTADKTLTVAAGANDINLLNVNNQISTIVVSNGNNVNLQNSTALKFGASSISGDLNVVLQGEVTQSGILSVTGNSSFNVGEAKIVLDQNNLFTGAVSLTNSGEHPVTVKNNKLLTLGASSLGTSTLSIIGVGIAQSGPIIQFTNAGAVSINGLTAPITLNNSNNHFTGNVQLNTTSAAGDYLTNNAALVLAGTASGGGKLYLTAGGTISQVGPIINANDVVLNLTAPNSDILLGSQPNNYSGSLIYTGTLSNIRDIARRNVSPTAVAAGTETADIVNLRNLTIIFDNANIQMPGRTLHNGGNLVIDSSGSLSGGTGGDITQLGVFIVPGTSTFNAGNHKILLTLANVLTGAVTLKNTGNNVVALTNNQLLNIATSNIGSNSLNLNGIGIAQSGPIIQEDHAGNVTINANAGPINLGNGTNHFTGAIPNPDGSITGSISLNNSGANDVELTNNAALSIATSPVGSGKLTLTAGGNISQTGPITQTPNAQNGAGAVTLTVTVANSDILLASQPNNFYGSSNFGGNRSNIRDIARRNINPNAATTGANLTEFTKLRNLTIIFDNAGVSSPGVTLHDGGSLYLKTNGDINLLSPAVIPGTTTLIAGSHAISFAQNNSLAGDVFLSNGGNNNVAVSNSLPLKISASTVGSGTLTLTGVGIIETGAVKQAPGASTVTLNAGANSIQFNHTDNLITGPLTLNNSGANLIHINNANTLNLAASNIGTGALTLAANDVIQQSGIIKQVNPTGRAVPGDITFIANTPGTNIDLSTFANNLVGPIKFGGTLSNIQDFRLRNANSNALVPNNLGSLTNLRNLAVSFDNTGISFPAVTLHNNGSLISVANGPITQTGALAVPGTSLFNAGANAITLSAANNFIGAVSLTNTGNNNVEVINATQLVLNTSNMGTGELRLQGLGVSQIGPIKRAANAKSTFINAGAGPINLTHMGNHFTAPVSLNNSDANNVALTNDTELTLAKSTLGSGSIALTASGNIKQTDALTANSTAIIFTLNSPNSDLRFADYPNNFTGPVTITPGANVHNVGIRNINAAGVSISNVSALNQLNDFTLILDNGPAVLPALSLQGNLHINTSGNLSNGVGGSISQTAQSPITIAGNADFIAGAHPITLGENNHFMGQVTLSNNGINDVLVNNITELKLGYSVVGSGKLTLSGVGFSQTDGIVQAANADTVTLDAHAGKIDLAHARNNFTGVVILKNSGPNNVALRTGGALNLGTSNVGSGTLSLASSGGMSQVGPITQAPNAGAITITQNSTGDILLNQANSLNGSITFGGNLSYIRNLDLRNIHTAATLPTNLSSLSSLTNLNVVFDNAGVILPALTLNSGGNLNINTSGAPSGGTGGSITQTQTGVLTVPGSSTFNAGVHPITLTGNNLLTDDVTLINSGNNNVVLKNNKLLNLSASNVGFGTLNLTGVGVMQSGAIVQEDNPVTPGNVGNVTVQAGAGVISLSNSDNHFLGTVLLSNSGANNVALTNNTVLKMGSTTVGSGTLDLTAGGTISESGAITQAANAGTVTLSVTAPGSDIILDTQPNNFSGAVMYGGDQSNIRDLGRRNINPNAGVSPTNLSLLTNVRNVRLILDNADAYAPTLVLHDGGSLYVDTSGRLSGGTGGKMIQLGPATIPGTTTLIAGSHSITVAQDNYLSGDVFVSNTGNNNIVLKNLLPMKIGTSTVGSGTLTITGAGISQTGPITQEASAGVATFNAGANNIDLSNTNNHFTGPVAFNNTDLNNVTFKNNTNIIMATSSVGAGLIDLVANGDMTQTGPITQFMPVGFIPVDRRLGGLIQLTTGAQNDIIFDNNANSFYNVKIVDSTNATIYTTRELQLTQSTVSGTLDVKTGGLLSQFEVLTANTLHAATIGGIYLDAANHIMNFSATNNLNGGVTLNNVETLNISSITQNANGIVNITNIGALTTGPISTDGASVNLVTSTPDTNTRKLIINGNIHTNGASISATTANPSNVNDAIIVNGELRSSPGENGILTLGGGVVLNKSPIVGKGDITLQGQGDDLTLTDIDFQNAHVSFAVRRNIIVTGKVSTDPGYNVTLIADSDGDGLGGVLVTHTGSIDSGGNITLRGSNLAGTSAENPNAGVEIQSGATITAANEILIEATLGDADIVIRGPLETTADEGSITVAAAGTGEITLDADVTIKNGYFGFNNPVNIIGTHTVTAGATGSIEFENTLSGDHLNIVSGGAEVIFENDVNINKLTTNIASYPIIFEGLSNSINTHTTFNNTGGVTFAINDQATFTFNQGLTYTAGTSITQGTISSPNHPLTLGTVILAGNTTLSAIGSDLTIGEVSGPYNLTLYGNTIHENHNMNIGGSLSFHGDVVFGNTTINAQDGVTFGDSATNNVTLNGALSVTTNQQPIVFNATVNGANSLTLNAGSLGDITFNAAVGNLIALDAINIISVRNLTSQNSIKTKDFQQHSGTGTTNFMDGGLYASNALIVTNVLLGTINVNKLTKNISSGNYYGSVAGDTGETAIKSMTILNPVLPNTIFFNGIDIYYVLNPEPPPPPVPPVPTEPVIPLPPNFPGIVFPTDYFTFNEDLTVLEHRSVHMFLMNNAVLPDLVRQLGLDPEYCKNVSLYVVVCRF